MCCGLLLLLVHESTAKLLCWRASASHKKKVPKYQVDYYQYEPRFNVSSNSTYTSASAVRVCFELNIKILAGPLIARFGRFR